MVERKKRLILPGLYFDNQNWVPASRWPNYIIYTDVCLAQTLMVSPMRVGMWRNSGKIPFEKKGNFHVYRLNEVLEALKKQGYEIDPKLKSKDK